MAFTPLELAIVIPTYGRERVLLDTVRALLDLAHPFTELILVDQTTEHGRETVAAIEFWQQKGRLRWLRLPSPCIPHAMNSGLEAANADIVLFLDDDIVPDPVLLSAHAGAHSCNSDAWAVVGQVLQPGEESLDVDYESRAAGLVADLDFPFYSNRGRWVENVMAGNLSVKRELALSIGGFDENFIPPVAYRFETEFARRIVRAGGKIWFEPTASIQHLRACSGGTRTHGSHLTSPSPLHGVGDYYYAFRCGSRCEALRYSLRRMFREVRTKFHLKHPWYIPIKLIGEVRACLWASRLARQEQKLIERRS